MKEFIKIGRFKGEAVYSQYVGKTDQIIGYKFWSQNERLNKEFSEIFQKADRVSCYADSRGMPPEQCDTNQDGVLCVRRESQHPANITYFLDPIKMAFVSIDNPHFNTHAH